MVHDKFGDPVTEERWLAVAACIDGFAKRYPKHWAKFMLDLHENKTEYGLAFAGDLKEAGWRNTASFPVVYRHATPEEKRDVLTGHEEDDLIEVASLVDPLKMLLPGLLEPDQKGKKNKLYREFLKRFQLFSPADKF